MHESLLTGTRKCLKSFAAHDGEKEIDEKADKGQPAQSEIECHNLRSYRFKTSSGRSEAAASLGKAVQEEKT
jgi:hypothetical protein